MTAETEMKLERCGDLIEQLESKVDRLTSERDEARNSLSHAKSYLGCIERALRKVDWHVLADGVAKEAASL